MKDRFKIISLKRYAAIKQIAIDRDYPRGLHTTHEDNEMIIFEGAANFYILVHRKVHATIRIKRKK